MSDSEATRDSLPSISDLSLNPQTTPSARPASGTEGKPKKDVEKGMCAMQLILCFCQWIMHLYDLQMVIFYSGNIIKTHRKCTNNK